MIILSNPQNKYNPNVILSNSQRSSLDGIHYVSKVKVSTPDTDNEVKSDDEKYDNSAEHISLKTTPSTCSEQIILKKEIIENQSMIKPWCNSLINEHIIVELIVKSLQIGVIIKLFLIYTNMSNSVHNNSNEYYLIVITLYASIFICIIYKITSCFTVYLLSHKCIDIILELFNFTLRRCLYVNYRLYSEETSVPQKFVHILHSSLKTSILLIIFRVLLIDTNNNNMRHDIFIICCIIISFLLLPSNVISDDTNIIKNHWKYSQSDCINCQLDVKYICRSFLWRFSEISYICLNRSVLCLGAILFYHATAGKYFSGGPVTKTIGYHIFVIYSIYRFLSSFLYLILLTVSNFIIIDMANEILYTLMHLWITFILWILYMFYVTEKGSKAVYSD